MGSYLNYLGKKICPSLLFLISRFLYKTFPTAVSVNKLNYYEVNLNVGILTFIFVIESVYYIWYVSGSLCSPCFGEVLSWSKFLGREVNREIGENK